MPKKTFFQKKSVILGFGKFPLKPLFDSFSWVFTVLGQKHVLGKTDSVQENARHFLPSRHK